jgi:DNA helicase-2/ATP-dependent DNA helicase PcrA
MGNPILKHAKLSKDSATFLHDLFILFRQLRDIKEPKAAVQKIALSALYGHVIEMLSTKRAMTENGSIDERAKSESQERIRRKCTILFELARPYKDHERFLNAMVLGSQDLTQGEGVHLLSIHASKGLEYQEVYVIDLMDGRFPNRKLMSRSGSIEEERRLFYVAVTRAKDRLFLSYAKYDKIKKTNFVPSQFLFESGLIPKDEMYAALVAKGAVEEA